MYHRRFHGLLVDGSLWVRELDPDAGEGDVRDVVERVGVAPYAYRDGGWTTSQARQQPTAVRKYGPRSPATITCASVDQDMA